MINKNEYKDYIISSYEEVKKNYDNLHKTLPHDSIEYLKAKKDYDNLSECYRLYIESEKNNTPEEPKKIPDLYSSNNHIFPSYDEYDDEEEKQDPFGEDKLNDGSIKYFKYKLSEESNNKFIRDNSKLKDDDIDDDDKDNGELVF